MDIKYCIFSARLRTLPLALSGILLSTLIALSKGYTVILICIFSCITALLLQILANFSNDYGDSIKGTDNSTYRINIIRSTHYIESGRISYYHIRYYIICLSIICLFSALLLVNVLNNSIKIFTKPITILCLFSIMCCIHSAVKYTIGKNAYGYKGAGDIYVFMFFGFLPVEGVYLLYTHHLQWDMIFPSISIGLLSMSVLNINNMRDIYGDIKSGKHTIVVKMGLFWGKIYHFFLVILPFILGNFFIINNKFYSIYHWIFYILFLPIFLHIKKIFRFNLKELDNEIKKMSIYTFLYAILLGIGQIF
jgi:1,4-dihydroxy-2-naphthoate octaprenyltransferase